MIDTELRMVKRSTERSKSSFYLSLLFASTHQNLMLYRTFIALNAWEGFENVDGGSPTSPSRRSVVANQSECIPYDAVIHCLIFNIRFSNC